jgi:hypothetical protein
LQTPYGKIALIPLKDGRIWEKEYLKKLYGFESIGYLGQNFIDLKESI